MRSLHDSPCLESTRMDVMRMIGLERLESYVDI